ncbi:MAG: leucyl aminopeptidase [Acidobacteria bacterium]|nr:leucyl aminopeptidase [Acidobacteriota bacterium]
MKIALLRQTLEALETEAAVVPVFEGRPDPRFAALFDSGEAAGKPLELTLLHRPPGLKARRVLLVGLGKPESFSPAVLRKVAAAALRHLRSKSVAELALVLEGDLAAPEHAAAAVEGALLGDFEPDRYKNDPARKTVHTFSLAVSTSVEGIDDALRRGRIVSESQNLARELINEPGNRMTPRILAERARRMAEECGLGCEILEQDRLRQLGMGALLSVGMGSAEPPALIVLTYRPAETGNGAAHLGLVGKGVTFDTGGISIKPADGMEKMKYDMSGGAAVIGAMRALAELKPAIAVTGLVPAVENMPGGRAQRPGDIVTSLAGKTIEVINTDAEGRMILADALTYARQRGCTHLVDAATLTGAVVVALAHVYIGGFASDDAFFERVQAAARAAGERIWRMPLDEDYKEYLKSAFADLPNSGGRWGGAVTAAMFLKEFADPLPWVHLDIAGLAWLDEAKPFLAKGPSGAGLRTFVNLAMNWRE